MTSVLTLRLLFTSKPLWGMLELIDQGSNYGVRFAGRDQWTASFIGSKSGIQTRGNTCEELAVFSFGFSCWAGQSAGNAGTAYDNPCRRLKRGIAGDQRLVQGIIVRQSSNILYYYQIGRLGADANRESISSREPMSSNPLFWYGPSRYPE